MATLFQVLTLVVLFQLFFVSFFLFTSKKGVHLSNILLAFFFLSLGAGVLDYFLLMTGFFKGKTQYAFLLNSLVIFHAPLLLLYTQSLTRPKFRLRFIHLLHGLPFAIIFLLLSVFYYNQSPEIQQWVLEDVQQGKDLLTILITLFGLLYELAYLIAVKVTIRSYREKIKQHFSNIDKINLNWLNFLVNLFIIFFLASTAANLLRHTQILPLQEGAVILGLFGLFVFISTVLLKGLHQNEIFLGADRAPVSFDTNPDKKGSLLNRLKQHLEENQPYMDPDLTLNDLASQIEASPRQLSTLINTELGNSFFDLINGYRIETAKRIFRESKDPKLTILEVMYEVGFNSKSSFNAAFKRITGETPSAFRAKNS